MTIDFLIGAIRASRDLHPQVQTELEEILNGSERLNRVRKGLECCSACTNENPFQRCDECPYNEVGISVQDCRAVLSADAFELLKGVSA